MTGILNDHRTKDTRPIKEVHLWAVATDRFMSGWVMAPRKSYVAYPLDKLDEQGQKNKLLDWMKDRSFFLRVRINLKLPRLQDGDHLSIYDSIFDVPDQITGRVAGYSNPTTFTMETKE